MTFAHLSIKPIAPIHPTSHTCLLLVDCQFGYRDLAAWSSSTPPSVSNPAFDASIAALLTTFRTAQANHTDPADKPLIIHVQTRPPWTDHPLHVSKVGPWAAEIDPATGEHAQVRNIDFLECAIPYTKDLHTGVVGLCRSFDEPDMETWVPPPPDPNAPPRTEILATSHTHSIWINTPLEKMLKERKIRTLIIVGMSLEGTISTAVRMGHDLALTGKLYDMGNDKDADTRELQTDGVTVFLKDKDGKDLVNMTRIVLVGDATQAYGTADAAAEIVHKVHLDSLREFAEVRKTSEILSAFL
jgi:nicotinamidase-related amidase